MKSNNLILTLVLIVVFAGAGFFAGTKYQLSKTPTFAGRNGQTGQFGQMGNRAVGNRGGQILGDIISADNNSITVKLADGSSKIIILANSSTINKATAGTPADLTVGTRVAVFGTTNTDGSVTAQNVQINPIARGPIDSKTTPAPSR